MPLALITAVHISPLWIPVIVTIGPVTEITPTRFIPFIGVVPAIARLFPSDARL